MFEDHVQEEKRDHADEVEIRMHRVIFAQKCHELPAMLDSSSGS